MKEFIFTWSIENISFSGPKDVISSPLFFAGPIQNTFWNLHLYSRGKYVGDYLSLFLHRGQDSGPENISVNFELSCISDENTLLHSHVFPEEDKSFRKNGEFGHPRFMERYEVFYRRNDLYLPRDVLTLRCRIWKNEGNVKESDESFGFTRFEIERILKSESILPQIGKQNTINILSKSQNTVLISIDIFQYEYSVGIKIHPIHAQEIKSSVLKLSFVENSNGEMLYEYTCSWLYKPLPETWRLPVQLELSYGGKEDLATSDVKLISEFVYSTGWEIKMLEKTCPSSTRLSVLVSKYLINCIQIKNISDCPKIIDDLWNLYAKHILCDVEIKTQTVSFFVHKIVLCARSSVFLAMLTGDMKEKKNECIYMEDILDNTLEKFVLFLYTDSFEDLDWKTVADLYYASNKYQIKLLKLLCCSYLLKNINFDNASEILMLADRHHDLDFKRQVENYILQNDKDIFSSSVWKQFADEQSLLAAKTMLLKYDKERGEENTLESYHEKLSCYPTIQDDFIAAFKDKIACDVVIETASATFHAHKSVLCASSTVMEEIFMNDMEEKPINIIKIQDVEDDIVSRLLLFLYTDSLEDVQWDTAIKLYHAANVYKIQRLQIKCSCFLLENLEISKASNLLLLAHEHSDVKLKSVVKDYIFIYDEEIFGSDEWANFSASNLSLANETMCSKYRKKSFVFPF